MTRTSPERAVPISILKLRRIAHPKEESTQSSDTEQGKTETIETPTIKRRSGIAKKRQKFAKKIFKNGGQECKQRGGYSYGWLIEAQGRNSDLGKENASQGTGRPNRPKAGREVNPSVDYNSGRPREAGEK